MSSLVPGAAAVADLRESTWDLVRQPLPAELDSVVDRVYDSIGDESLDSLGVATPQPARDLVGGVVRRFLESEQGKAFIAAQQGAKPVE